MSIWAIADLHLSFGIPDKGMDVFGERWVRHTDRVKEHWLAKIKPDDLVLIPGDISWAKKIDDALPDLQWINALPGTKVLTRGNHDYWWESLKKLASVMPPSLHVVQNNAFSWKDVSIAGCRLWDSNEYDYDPYVEYINTAITKRPFTDNSSPAEAEKIFERELLRLEISLKCLDPKARLRVAMVHYPPIGPDMKPSRVSQLLVKYNVNVCVFGHLHNVKLGSLPYGMAEGVRYYLTACDYIDCNPVLIEKG